MFATMVTSTLLVGESNCTTHKQIKLCVNKDQTFFVIRLKKCVHKTPYVNTGGDPGRCLLVHSFQYADLFRSTSLLGSGKMGHAGVLLHDVISQLVWPGEALRTLGARERPFSRVRSVMPLQMRQSQEWQVTERTLVRFQPRVRLHMTSEVLFVEECPLACGTLDRAGQVDFGLSLDECLEVDLGGLVFGLCQYGRFVLVHVFVHHYLWAQHGRVFERRIVIRWVVLTRDLECPRIRFSRAIATVCLKHKHAYVTFVVLYSFQ